MREIPIIYKGVNFPNNGKNDSPAMSPAIKALMPSAIDKIINCFGLSIKKRFFPLLIFSVSIIILKAIMKQMIRTITLAKLANLYMNVPPSKKATIYVVSENEEVRATFENAKVFFAQLGSASEVLVQANKDGIGEDAVSAVTADAVLYMPLAELVDIAKEIERLKKEEEKLQKELARSKGMLSNERFISKAPEAKIAEEKEKLAKYEAMMAQVQERLAALGQ